MKKFFTYSKLHPILILLISINIYSQQDLTDTRSMDELEKLLHLKELKALTTLVKTFNYQQSYILGKN
jgi:hypothetical protein